MPADLEPAIAERLAAGDLDDAVTLALRGYGPEIYSYLRALHRDPADADEVFALFSEALWRSLRGRVLRCSHRTWAYAVARRSSLGYRRAARRRAARQAPWSETSELPQIAAAVRTATALHLRTEVQSRFLELRASLPEADQTLLMLRVDRGLAWNDLVEILAEDGDAPRSPDAVRRHSARLRKRFEALKTKLRAMARAAGLDPRRRDAT
ncbi:MAG TPA: hypothetical protein VHW23_31990 [Kofleriaceae bacterium]|jgi:RNA polymerase sigma-70 factor (ECF subfamily)|nr:hypothetical protein [Kofleriaceae bacterium]